MKRTVQFVSSDDVRIRTYRQLLHPGHCIGIERIFRHICVQEFDEFGIDPSFNTLTPLHGTLLNELAVRTLPFFVWSQQKAKK